ncbi:MAG: DUF3090 family protein [Ardenticatenales bacterium]
MARDFAFDLDPVSFITVGAVGQPGDRTFYLQAAQQSLVVSLRFEKEQALALAAGIEQLFTRLQESGVLPEDLIEPVAGNMGLLLPIEPAFRVVQMGIGVDEARGLVVLIAEERGDDVDDDGDDGDGNADPIADGDQDAGLRARFTASYAQMAAVANHAIEVARQGRPTCPLCGEPMDEGHFCPRKNGKPGPPPGMPDAS